MAIAKDVNWWREYWQILVSIAGLLILGGAGQAKLDQLVSSQKDQSTLIEQRRRETEVLRDAVIEQRADLKYIIKTIDELKQK